jgi:hypothetical protein
MGHDLSIASLAAVVSKDELIPEVLEFIQKAICFQEITLAIF